jgi:choline dehydrogenase
MRAHDVVPNTIIVGAGTAGCLLADRLSRDPDRQVLLVEAGVAAPPASAIPALWTSMFNSEADWSFHTEPQVGACMRRIYTPRGRMIGGSGALNAMICMRGLPSDYERWRDGGCPGWGWKDVKPYFIRLERNGRHRDSEHHSAAGEVPVNDPVDVDDIEHAWLAAASAAGIAYNQDFNGATQEGVGFFQLNIANGERVSTASCMLSLALTRPNFRLLPGAYVTRLIGQAGRITGIEYLCEGRITSAHVDGDVILSAGAIGTPHLLLLSGIGPAADLRALGIEVLYDLPGVGENLSDHPHLSTSWATRQPAGLTAMSREERGLQLKRWDTSRSGVYAGNGSVVGACVRSDPSVVEPDLQLYCTLSPNRNHGRFLAMEPGIMLSATLQRPKSLGRVKLRSRDPLVHPMIDPAYFSDPEQDDVAVLVRALKIQRRIAAHEPLRSLLLHESSLSAGCQPDEKIADYVRAHSMTIFHLCGSARMGSDRMAVVDPKTMKVHGVEGLRVADASVFPNMVSGNINTPVMMVAEKASDLMRFA